MDPRAALVISEVTRALDMMRAGNDVDAGKVFAHIVHDGACPSHVVAEVIEQTGGSL